MPPRIVRVAVVGAGLSGLTVAYLLSTLTLDPESESVSFEVHLFEKADVLGMDSNSISVTVPTEEGNKAEMRIDVPMRSFQDGYYTHLIRLYRHVGVNFRIADFSYSFSALKAPVNGAKPKIETFMIYNGQSGRAGVSIPSARKPTASCTIFTLARWTGADLSWHHFVGGIVIPLFSAVCTASAEDVYSHPAEEILEYLWQSQGTHHYVVSNGVRDVVDRLSRPLPAENIHLSSAITSIKPDPENPSTSSVYYSTLGGEHVLRGCAHVVICSQANQAARILSTYSASLPEASAQKPIIDAQISCLGKFAYCRAVVVNHTDPALLPDGPGDWRDLNLVCMEDPHAPYPDDEKHADICVSPSYAMTTHRLPRASPSHPTIYQTTNPIISPRQESILSVAVMERALLTVEAKQALRGLVTRRRVGWLKPREITGLGPLQGGGSLMGERPGIWLCGSYAHPGIPLLEPCVASARNVVENGILVAEKVTGTTISWDS
ncbi:hypothetical protein BOTBODRAFT_101781 [Botryobasidium botryosum FD-172 SS1]|uniref:Amine oxidase domain-containing protein n=1 Tax=Botryobasidium botryosum (strain FD-172 SS1) TaxID=930990 RepID=A0A067MYZ4_BOTB1|nr:hypothetical protein BOTBODRAFT_101781 [Botryobasidium botryosum FD-172 SS1]